MKMVHPWLEKYPIKKDSKYLIIGTHPPMPYCGKLEFYYGNMSEFWRFLDLVYPGHKLYENGCPKIEDIIIFLEKSKLSITDIVNKTSVAKFSTDADMGKINNDDLNPSLFKWLKESSIEKIYFTSFSGKNSAKNLFKKWFKSTYGKTCRVPSFPLNKIEINGRIIETIDLYSPSPTARRGLPNSQVFKDWSKKHKKSRDYDGFRLYWYQKYLPKLTK
jgi:G:T/U-mismatch repair DNA glycosylase